MRLYDKGLIYRGRRLVNWDPVLRTAVSDLEVKSEEEEGHLWHIRYPLCDSPEDGPAWVVVATTRPETMLGDVAVAVHPDDPRYADLVGRRVELPLAGRTIPIVADEAVVPEFGTGCLKITPAHDFNDYAVGERHGLPSIDIFTDTAHLNENAPAPYRGLDRFVARERIVADLRAADRLDRVESYRHQIPRGERTGAVVEPRLTAQWFVRAGPARRTRHPRRRVRPGALRSRELGEGLLPVDARHRGLVHQPPDLVGAPHSRVVRPGRRHLRGKERGGGSGAPRSRTGDSPRTGPGRARYLVLLGPLAVFHPGMAARVGAARSLLPDQRTRHRVRHHLLLGRPDDHDGR